MEAGATKSTEKLISTFFSLLLLTLVLGNFNACSNRNKWVEINPAFSKYIDAYTTGVVSKTSPIRIQLAAALNTTHAVGEEIKEAVFELSPSVKGKAVWMNPTTIEFHPEKQLKPDQLYTVHFNLGKVASSVPKAFHDFAFNIKTTKPDFLVKDEGLRSIGNKNNMQIAGVLETADIESGKELESLLEARQDGNKLTIQWQHQDAVKQHRFTVSGIQRGPHVSEVILAWDGDDLDIDQEGETKIPVPAAGDFKVMEVRAVSDVQQYASVLFSDPVSAGQDLTGLISISGQAEPTFSINGSEVKIFTGSRLEGNFTVQVNPGIKNTYGEKLSVGFTANINFENKLPSVKIFGKGNILPNSGRLVLPFDAVNLSAVDVSIIKIYETNVPRFLQENTLNGEQSLRMVARPIVQKTIRLDSDKQLDLHRKQRFSLDIDQFLKTEPGAIYRVTIGFRPEYSLFTSVDTATKSDADDDEEDDYYGGDNQKGVDEDDAFWKRYDTYYPFGYNWSKRDDPASKSYYNKDRWATRNIIASNIGLTAKRTDQNRLFVAVSNLLTTNPMEGVELEVLDFQQMLISKAISGADGFADIELKRKPYLLIAKNNKEKAYLRLDDGSALPFSRFDVSGEEVKNGIKGFIFGERGVWRPGDTMFINCIIEDKDKKLPEDHPIEFNLITPQGQLYKQAFQNGAKDGFYLFKTFTDVAAPTGNWLARIKCGGAVFEKRIRVETVMPNRLKINVDFGKEGLLGMGGVHQGKLQSNWLFGAPGKGLKAKVDVDLKAGGTRFSKFKDFVFDNPTTGYATQSKTIFDGTLDATGSANLKTDFETDEVAPGMLTANLLVKVFEPGGAFSIDNMSINYSPFNSYAGLLLPKGNSAYEFLLSGQTHTAQLANVDSKGNALPNSEVEVQFYKMQWRWWWDNNGDNLSNFTQNEYNKLLKKETVKLINGKGQWNFGIGANEWGRYLILVKDLKSGHITGKTVYLDEPGWQSRGGAEEQTAATMLSFTSDKEKYQIGEEVVLNIPSSKGGRMLVSLESGSKVIRSFWQETQAGQTQVRFKTDASMAPNIYATVSLLQPHAQTVNDLPIRMYGAIPVFVENKNTILRPIVDIPATIRSEQQVSIAVSEQDGKEMSYSIAIVDEGLLDLTHYKTPDPHRAFYAREALGVKSFDLYDYVIGAWAGGMDRILTIGGDADGGVVKQKTANRFKPVVKYLGPFYLKKGQSQRHQFTLPAYVGSVRAMVVAAHDGSYGFAEKNVAVKKPLMLLATVPRVLSPGETIKLPVTIFATDPAIKSVQVSLQPNSLFQLVGAATQQVNFVQTGEELAYFDIQVKQSIGIGKLKLTATGGTEKASYDVELDIRNPNPPITQVAEMVVNGGGQWKTTAQPIGMPAQSSAMLEISSVPSMNLQKRLDYLITYPHGCVEQTTSAVFPQLLLRQLTDLDEYRIASIEKNVRAGIERLQNFQKADGGFSYWPGMGQSDEWGSNYAGHFLVEASNNGYTVNEYMLQQWKQFQKNRANSWVVNSSNFYGADLNQAYRLYTLALAKSPELGAMNRLKEFRYLSLEAKWRLAAAYKLAGQEETALQLISGLATTFPERSYAGYTYGSALRDEAMVLETLTLLNKRTTASGLVYDIAAKLSRDNWYSTQTTAFSILAIARYCGKNPSGEKINAKVTVGAKVIEVNAATYIRQIPISLKAGASAIQVNNNGANTLYLRLITQGQPFTGDSVSVPNNPALLTMNVSYLSADGKPMDITKITQGSDFIAKVVIKNTGKRGAYSQMSLSQVFPSGWEILNARMVGGEGAYQSSPATYQDIRDDRVYTYFNIQQNETLTYYVQLNAAYLGKYYLPATVTEAMYDRTISAGIGGKWVEVLK